jgi:hypothetical protein
MQNHNLKQKRAGGMVQMVESLPSKHKALIQVKIPVQTEREIERGRKKERERKRERLTIALF